MHTLVGMAGLAQAEQPERAARLLGAVAAMDERTHGRLWVSIQAEAERIVRTVRAHLDDDAFANAWADGRALSLEQAMAEAERVSLAAQTTSAPLSSASSALELAGLTARELEVLRLVARGLTNEDIAQQLPLSRRTIHAHLRSIFSKLDVTTRTAAARIALEYNLI